MIHVYFDGSTKPSPGGKSRTCFVVIYEDGRFEIKQEKIGYGLSSTEIEWHAFLASVQYCVDNQINDVHFFGDCMDVIEGAWGIPRKQMTFINQFKAMLKPDDYIIDHVRRDINLAGIVLDDGDQSRDTLKAKYISLKA